MKRSETINLLCELIAKPSITPDDNGCQEILRQRLTKLGFNCDTLQNGAVTNLWAIKGDEAPIIAFAGHTDVVPPGDLDEWITDPFSPDIREGFLYGRGASDMKSGIAAMVTAVERFFKKHPDCKYSFAFLITSDEEGAGIDGTRKIMEYLHAKEIKLSACIVGEPSCSEALGDTIKIGRRGSLSGKLIVYGLQGHVAYPQQAENPINRIAAIVDKFSSIVWDEGNDNFPPTTFQISNIKSGTGVDNVIPGSAEYIFNFRYSTELTADTIKNKMVAILNTFNYKYELFWNEPDYPFLTKTGNFITACTQAVTEITGISPELSTSGGTSDGRFIAPTGTHVVELGVCNKTIHSVNECVKVQDVDTLSAIYERILEIILSRLDDKNLPKNLYT